MKSIFVTAFALGFTGTASAADLPVKAVAPMAPAPSWDGWYVGVNGGGVWGRSSTSLIVAPNGYFAGVNSGAVQAAGTTQFDNSGGLAGAQIGVLHQWGPIVGGLELGFDWMGVNSSSTINAIYPTQACNQPSGCAFSLSSTTKSEWLLTFLGRAGLDMGAWYPYVTGGLALTELKYSVAFIDNNTIINATTAGSFSRTVPGFAGGAGVEWRWDSHWSVRGEYLRVSFDQVSGRTPQLTSLIAGFPATTNYNVSARLIENIGRAAVSYRF
jgi:outer membrane immunogenic protein